MAQKLSEQEKKQIRLFDAYKNVFSSPMGKAVLGDMMAKFHVKHPVRGDDPYDTYFRDGQRSVVLHIMGHLQLETKEYKEILLSRESDYEI